MTSFNIQPGKVGVVLYMIEAENTAISSIQNDLRTLGEKVDRMEDMLETLIGVTQLNRRKIDIFRVTTNMFGKF